MLIELTNAVVTIPKWEALAVVLAIAYLLLAAREHIACWACAFLSTAIYTALFWDVSLIMEALLNVYYMVMAAYGWRAWRKSRDNGTRLAISVWSLQRHLGVISAVIVLSAITGSALSAHTGAAWPYVDSFTTWGAVVTTYMVTRKILENWIYWFVLDSISIPLYLERGLHLTAGLFALYLVIVVCGFIVWSRQFALRANDPLPA